jgi:hypothetical protein
MSLTIGADPEIFMFHEEEGRHVCAIDKVPGTKDAPFIVGNGGIHVDNMAAECSVAPATTASTFSDNIGEMLGIFSKGFADYGCVVSRKDVVEFDPDQFYHPDAYAAGCEPSICAWGVNPSPEFGESRVRCAGGHVHIGLDIAEADIPQLVKCLDVHLTLGLLDRDDPRRRALYGLAGEYRRKPYGLEYRTPSNQWIFTDEDRKAVFDKVRWCVENYKDISAPSTVAVAINKHDLQLAKEILLMWRRVDRRIL